MSSELLDYLQKQQGVIFKRLYQQPSTVLAVLRRMLPHLGQWHYSLLLRALLTALSENHGNGDAVHVRTSIRRGPDGLD